MVRKVGELQYDLTVNDAKLRKAQKAVDDNNNKLQKSFKMVGAAIGAAFTAEAARRVLVMANNFQLLDVRIKNATKSEKEFNRAQKELLRISNATGSALGESVKLFESLTIAAESLNASNDQVLLMTQNLQQLGIIGGSTGEQMSNAMLQFGQAMAGGVVRAEEFNSIIENTPRIAQAIAEGLGKDVGQLRKMVIAGELLSEDVFESILKQSGKIQEKFDTMPVTLERSWSALSNNLGVAVSQLDSAAGFSETIAKWITQAADGLKEFNQESQKAEKIAANEAKIQEIIGKEKSRHNRQSKVKNKLAKEANMLLDRNLEIEKKLAVFENQKPIKVRGGAEANKRARERRTETIALLKKELDLNQRNLALLEKQNEGAAKVIELKRDSVAIDSKAASAPVSVATVPTAIAAPKGSPADFLSGAGMTDVSAHDEMMAKLGNETLEITNAYKERAAKILEIEEISEQERRDLLIANQEQTNRQLFELQKSRESASLDAMASFTDTFLQLLKAGGKEQTAVYKAIFLANKAIQVADIIANTEVAAAKAGSQLGVFGIPIATAIRAAGYASAGMVAGLAVGGGRQQGGNVSPGLMHPVNEDGNPELLVQGSKQFLLPGRSGGKVVPAGDMAMNQGSQTPNVVINNNGAPVSVDRVSVTRDEIEIMISESQKQTVDTVNNSLATGRGATSQALRTGHRVERNLS